MRKEDIKVGDEYNVHGYPGGRFKVTSLKGRSAMQVTGVFPDSPVGRYRDGEVSVTLRSITARWDDPAEKAHREWREGRAMREGRALAICKRYGIKIESESPIRSAEAYTTIDRVHIDIEAFIKAFEKK